MTELNIGDNELTKGFIPLLIRHWSQSDHTRGTKSF